MPARLKPPIDSTGIRRSNWHVELIACGYAHTVFLTENLSSVFSCGANSWGQLGLGDTDDRNTPCEVEMLSGVAVRQLDCGGAHTVVVCDGPRVPAKYQWWDMSSPKVPRSKGADKAPGSPPAEAPEFGESAGPPPPTASGVYGFGRNKEGQLGLGKGKGAQLAEQIQKQPKLVGELSPYLPMQGGLELKCGGYHTAVLVEQRKKLLTFGQNCYGQLGLNSNEDVFVPMEVALPLAKSEFVKILACGGGHTMVVTEQAVEPGGEPGPQSVLAFGRNNRGQLGVGDTVHKNEPVRVEALCEKDIVQVECGSKHTIVLTRSDQLFAIGRNTEGQLGLGDVLQKVEPAQVAAMEWFPSAGHLSVSGFSAHNFVVPKPMVRLRREQVKVLCICQCRAFSMAMHRRLGANAQAHVLSMDLCALIGMLIPQRRTGADLAGGEEILARSPEARAEIARRQLRL